MHEATDMLRPAGCANAGSSRDAALQRFISSMVKFRQRRPTLPDPDDDLILELAVAAGCRYIVTHNLRDFRGLERWGVAAVSPADFLKQIAKET